MTNSTDLYAQLADLLVDMEEPEEPAASAPAPLTATSPPSAAAPAGAEVIVLADAREKAAVRKRAREVLIDDAVEVAGNVLQVIRQTFAESGGDFDDACKALPLVHKVIEHADRMEATARDPKGWPVLNFQIVLDDTPQVAPPRRAARVARIVTDATDATDATEVDAIDV